MGILTEKPKVTLRNYFQRPLDSSVAAARTCYSPRVIGTEEITEEQRSHIAALTFDAGHHTVYQHPHFEFGLENISRQFVWNFLHNYPFYNSEQSSQRFVRLDEIRAFVPPLDETGRQIYEEAVTRAWDSYRVLSDLLKKDTFEILSDIFKLHPTSSDKKKKKVKRDAEKKAIEVARYVIPIAAFTSMVHTISGITLHRLRRLMHSGDTPYETTQVIDEMVECVRKVDPAFFEKIGDAPLEIQQVPEFNFRSINFPPEAVGFVAVSRSAQASLREFDMELDGRVSKLVDYSPHAEHTVANALRYSLGVSRREMNDAMAIDAMLNPAKNRYRLDKLNLTYHAPLMKPLHHASYTFIKKISHTADSQDQRHRMVPGSRPMMMFTDTRQPDFITPRLIAANSRALEVYEQTLEFLWNSKNRLLDHGVPPEFALYLLPNAKALRFSESGSLLYLIHKWTMRTCFNAQDEIYEASMQELDQVRQVHPLLAKYLGPPCVVRVGQILPICSEGAHYCGVKVWERFPHVERRL
ncbi:MAG: FAD-dependent thymidylate synthase [Acidobacteriia bacterium]|nr:FAD-dependent thymidylate synthase [Terriglobia bacterium]